MAPRLTHAARLTLLTVCALLAFAGNSLLCRAALDRTGIDPLGFTVLRLFAGAAVLWALVAWRGSAALAHGSWISALALLAYALGFSWAYTGMTAGTGALLLFAAVQATMLAGGLALGARWTPRQAAGLVIAMAGLAYLLSPGLEAPAAGPAACMLLAGIGWGIYSLRGRGQADATATTAGNFLRAAPLSLLACLPWLGTVSIDAAGAALALVSGAVTSGLGYAVWYAALRDLTPQVAGSSQLVVPVVTVAAGTLLLSEPLGWRLGIASVIVLGGIALTLPWRRATRAA
ncbi:DMT family transporter [Arenimonas sp. MALMAid1274]|uniref:DMT family transporter n=1 Tax=Arenimonas sp. MALMAid1274 TaxID=3411630 RepID=UPI003BA13AA3